MINFYNSDKLKRLSSAIILTTMLGTSFTLSGCSKTSDKETVQLETSHKDEEKRKDYGVVIENDIAQCKPCAVGTAPKGVRQFGDFGHRLGTQSCKRGLYANP